MKKFRGNNSEILNCLRTAIIKRNHELERNDTQEQRIEFSIYKDALNKTDTVYEYSYTVEEYAQVGITDLEIIIKLNKDIRDMSLYLSEEQMDRLLENKRKLIVENYVETNPYVLTLMGKPTNTRQELYLGYHIDGIRDDIPISEMNAGEILILENKGILEKLVEENPDKEYLKFVNRRLSAYTVRSAQQYALMYIDTSYSVGFQIAELYERYRMYFMRTMYNEYYSSTYEFYEALTGAYIISAVVYTILTESSMNILEFDLTSDDILDSLYQTFSIPNIKELPKSVRIAFAEKINRILINKGSRQSIIDIADAFGVGEVYQYVLYKEYRDSEIAYNPSLSAEENYRLYFIRVPLKESDIHKYILAKNSGDEQSKIPFDEFVAQDKRWGLGEDNLSKLVLSKDFSYVTTKYIGVDNVISLVENALTQSEFLSMLFANKKQLGNYSLVLSRPNITVSLWEAFVYTMILIMNKNGYEDTIVSDPEGLCYIYGINGEDVLTETLINDIKKILPHRYHYLLEFRKFDQTLTLSQFMDICVHNRATLKALRNTILNWNDDLTIIAPLIKLEHLVSTMQKNKFYGDMKNYASYSDYIEASNPPLYTHLEAIRANTENMQYEMQEELLTAIEDLKRYCDPSDDVDKDALLDFLDKIQEDEAATIKTSMFQMIAFLKSYTVDMRMSGTTYVFKDYLKILDETIVKNHINLYSRLELKDKCSINVHYPALHSYLCAYDDLVERGEEFKISSTRLPPWMLQDYDKSYLRPDEGSYVIDTIFQSASHSYEGDELLIEDDLPLISYEYYLNDIIEPLSYDTVFQSASHNWEESFLNVEDTLMLHNMYHLNDRWFIQDDISLKRSPILRHDNLTVRDMLTRREDGRTQTDL